MVNQDTLIMFSGRSKTTVWKYITKRKVGMASAIAIDRALGRLINELIKLKVELYNHHLSPTKNNGN